MTLRIVFLDRETIAPHIRLRRPAFPHAWVEYGRTAPEQLTGRLGSDVEIIITNKVPLRAATLERLPALRLIAVAATGTDIVDLGWCRQHGLAVANIRGYAVDTVPEHTFALIFALRRSLLAYADAVRRGRWQESGQFCFFDYPIGDLAGSTLGIIGAGVLGKRVAAIGEALRMRVLLAGRKGRADVAPQYTPWDEVLATSDVITLHTPLLPETRELIALPEFRAMRRQPLLINTARGGLVNEADLVVALRQGLVAGAAFDVLTREPPAPDNPLLGLLDAPNFILTPHVAWASNGAMQRLADQLIDNIEHFVAGNPKNIVG
ncbi:MAG TPA: D-2-hydroxyacid dehydrogenase [Rhodospirillales bacterium]|nr:D-2-hydroxyacid dehydrogenase [Rhodospirillales bacterium]